MNERPSDFSAPSMFGDVKIHVSMASMSGSNRDFGPIVSIDFMDSIISVGLIDSIVPTGFMHSTISVGLTGSIDFTDSIISVGLIDSIDPTGFMDPSFSSMFGRENTGFHDSTRLSDGMANSSYDDAAIEPLS